MSEVSIKTSTLQDIANAIRSKNNETTLYYPSQMAGKIYDIASESSSEPIVEKDINFRDYDGRLIDSWFVTDLSSMSDLPELPYHSHLEAQGWNWTLEELIEHDGPMEVGVMYNTDNRGLIMVLDIDNDATYVDMSFSMSGYFEVDWGDGVQESISETSGFTTQHITHTYEYLGEYEVRVTPQDEDSYLEIGGQSSGSYSTLLGGSESGDYNYNKLPQLNMIRELYLGTACHGCRSYGFSKLFRLRYVTMHSEFYINTYAFNADGNLEYIAFPKSVTTLPNYTLMDCRSMRNLSVPYELTSIGTACFYADFALYHAYLPINVTSIGNQAFYNCYGIEYVNVPEGVTSIGTNTFYECRALRVIQLPSTLTTIGDTSLSRLTSLSYLRIPRGVTSFGTRMLSYTRSLRVVDFAPSTPPTVGSNAFEYVYSKLIAHVPYGSTDSYKSAGYPSTWTYIEGYL